MASNTKLSPAQKQYVKRYTADNIGLVFFNNGTITVMVQPEVKGSRMHVVSISTMAPNEQKFRKSVGKYYAITNRENGQYVIMNHSTLDQFLDSNGCLNTYDDLNIYHNM